MQSGNLDKKIYLQPLIETNQSGELQQSWDETKPFTWAEILTQRGSESFEAARTNANEIIRVRIRYRSDIDSEWRVKRNDRFYYISAVDDSEKRKGFLWFTAQTKEAR
jgi:SPP1 family predicted phage head-tail adaptor